MTKNQEIEILLQASAKLGDDSYCGPWLAGVAEEVRSEIRSDFMPSPSLWATEARCKDLLAVAKLEADKLVQDAIKTADNIRATARKDMDGAIARAIDALNMTLSR